MMKILKRFVCFCVTLVYVALFARSVAANGAPIKIFLNYLPEFSNYGPTEASGVALVSLGEAWVDLTADGLPPLEGELYEAWLVGAADGQMISLGTFNADADKHVAYFVELDDLPIIDYRYFTITIEPNPDPSPEADGRRTISGLFPNPELQIVNTTPTPTPEPGATPIAGPPATLPVTGDSGFRFWILDLGLLMLGLGITGFIFAKYNSKR